ncbi:GNAT family N-acetyltransferase [Candidatus Bipolaricaulota bacterium]|nr:GNAT family N-acetyltransferase [Candidatus Bipolaricaulota bacterium]
MKIVDLNPDLEPLYLVCLEDWSSEMRGAGDHKRRWYEKMKDYGLRVKVALDDRGVPGGMIQYLPIEHSFAEGRDLYMVLCIWVHGHNEGRGNFQGRGMGQALLRAAEEDARARGAQGMAAWGLALPFWMEAQWFKKHGYRPADRMGIQVLLWKPFALDAAPPRWIREKKRPERVPGVVSVVAFVNGWCQATNLVAERARRAAAGFGDRVRFEIVDTSDRATFLAWGISDALFIDGKQVRTGPPPSEDKLRALIARRVQRLPDRTPPDKGRR